MPEMDGVLPHLQETIAATGRCLASLERLSDDDVRAPSLLPGWSRGHVITHVARNADGLGRLLTWGATGEPQAQYSSWEARDADIEAGSGRPAAALLADARESAARWEQNARELPADRLEAEVARAPGLPTFPVRRVGAMRRTEVEVHHADLGVGYTAADWPEDFVDHLLKRRKRELTAAGHNLVLGLEDRGEEIVIAGGGQRVSGVTADLVWWLLGRGTGEGLACSKGPLPDLGRWA